MGTLARATVRIQSFYRRFKAKKLAQQVEFKEKQQQENAKENQEKATKLSKPNSSYKNSSRESPSAKPQSPAPVPAQLRLRSEIQSPKNDQLIFKGFDTSSLENIRSTQSTLILRQNSSRMPHKFKNDDFHKFLAKKYSKMKESSVIKNILAATKTNSLSYIQKKADSQILNPQNVNILDENKMSPLYYACYHGYPKMVQILLKYGADPNLKNKNGDTALHAAFKKDNIDVIGLLLENKANTEILNDFNQTPLFFAKPETARKLGLHKDTVFCGNLEKYCRSESSRKVTPKKFNKKTNSAVFWEQKTLNLKGEKDTKLLQTFAFLQPFFEKL